MQCTNATWKKAIQQLIDDADVIVLDLSNLSEKNQGVAYEIGKLFNEVPLSKVLILIDYTTDKTVLQKILDTAWNNMVPHSPNRYLKEAKIKLFDSGGTKTREANETLYDWKKRLNKRLEADMLVGLLLDMAITERTLAVPDMPRDDKFIYWTTLGFSGKTRKVINYSLVTLLAIITLLIILK